MMGKEDQEPLGLNRIREGQEGWLLLECRLPRPERAYGIEAIGRLPGAVPLLLLKS